MRLLSALLLLVVAFVPAAGAAEIGAVQDVTVYAYGTPQAADRRPLFVRSAVSSNEVVETVRGGGLLLEFNDGTEFRLGGDSRVTLDEFVYDPNGSPGKMTITMAKGVFRFVSGKLNKDGVQLRTPVAAIGIRGTDFYVVVADSGATSVRVVEGIVEVTPEGGEAIVVAAGNTLGVAATGAATPDIPLNVSDPAVTDEGPGPGVEESPSIGDEDSGGSSL